MAQKLHRARMVVETFYGARMMVQKFNWEVSTGPHDGPEDLPDPLDVQEATLGPTHGTEVSLGPQ